ncbi:MAG: aldo/keto reductase [Acholeplasmatales bacterium]|nr:MAG: aldo/keto reductase [Acholeplasmatales bacterium]
MSILQEYFTLANDIKLPKLGLGTYQLKGGEETFRVVRDALTLGIRHIDSAILYRNEASVGEAIRASGIAREELFITSKLPPHIKTQDGVMRMFEKTLKNLGVDYLDLYIINAPGPFHDLDGDYDAGNVEAYKTLEALYHDERVASIGVSQFKIKDIDNILQHCDIVPHVQQMSFFIGHRQAALVDYCRRHNIQIQAFSPLAKGFLFDNPVVIDIAQKLAVTPAQLALRFIIDEGIAPIPKASRREHLQENTMLDFAIPADDRYRLYQIVDDPRQYDDAI